MRRILKLALITLLFCGAALGMAALGVLTMDQPELANISSVAFFITFVFVMGALAETIQG